MNTPFTRARCLLPAVLALLASAVQAATYYVAPSGNDNADGSSAAPFLTIQRGVNAASSGDTVLVAPGIYATGMQTSTPASGYSRVVIAKPITVRSTHGAAQTVIRGQPNSLTLRFGSNSVRCVYMSAGTLDGFTLEDGYANANAAGSVMTDPVKNGGGVYTPDNIRTPQVNNCIITRCGAYRGGGAHWATLNNCTVTSNYFPSGSSYTAVFSCHVRNSIIQFNGVANDKNYPSASNSEDRSLFSSSCTLPELGLNLYGETRDGGNNLITEPLFTAGSLTLSDTSPCINAGANAFASGTHDAAGGARIQGGTVDMGAYERSSLFNKLIVLQGTGSGSYTNGTAVPIQAQATNAWIRFDGWSGDVATVVDTSVTNTTLIMPDIALTVAATYHALSLSEYLSEFLGIPLPITTDNIGFGDVVPGVPEVKLGGIGDSQSAFFSTVYTNAGTLLFPWRVSSWEGADRLTLIIDGVETNAISGNVSGIVTQHVAGAGVHTIRWAYTKDGADADLDDAGWVGAVTWIPEPLAAELGVPGGVISFPHGQPGASRPFPYGFEACFFDTNAPAGFTGEGAVKLGGLSSSGTPYFADTTTNSVEVVLFGAGEFSFNWCASNQLSDIVFFTIDGVKVASTSGKTGWLTFTTNLLTVGSHVFRWSYTKNASGFSGSDAVWIDRVTWTRFRQTLTVVSGSGSGMYAVGDTVVITADPALAGQEFVGWNGDTETVADPLAPSTTLTMPHHDLTVQALYKVLTFAVTVVNGRDAGAWPNPVHESTGEPEGDYPPGAVVRIVAAPAPLWQTFDCWTSADGAVFTDAFAEVSSFTLPSNAVTVTATYRALSAAEKLADALTIRGQPLVVTDFSPSGVVAVATGGIRYNDPVVQLGGVSVGPSQSVYLTTTNFTGKGILIFWWHGDTEDDVDGFQLEVNGLPYSTVLSMKDTNSVDATRIWSHSYAELTDVTNITWRYTRDDTYYVHQNIVLLDRVTWIPQVMIDELGAGRCVPNINAEYNPLFEGNVQGIDENIFEGEDGGVAWVGDAPGGYDAIRLGRFGYVTNNACAQVAFTNYGTGILTWQWTASSEKNLDTLGFYIDGAKTNSISGKRDGLWTTGLFVVTPEYLTTKSTPKNICNFRYQKDADTSMFDDCGWLRDVAWHPTYKLSLEKGSVLTASLAGAGYFPADLAVSIIADTPQAGYYFDRWTGTNVSSVLGAAVTNMNPSFLMPAHDVALTATYTTNAPPIPHYTLTVMNGSGTGSYPTGTVVVISADAPAQWHTFQGWTGETAAIDDVSSASTTVLIGTNNITVTAAYSATPVEELISQVLGVPAPVTVGNLSANNISLTHVTFGPVADSQTAFFQTVYTNAGTVIFPWSVDSEEGWDFLRFSVDGTNILAATGEQNGVLTHFVAGDGPHILRWSYEKDGSDSAGTDRAAIGAVTWIPDALAVELGTPGKTLYAPDGFDAVLLDTAPPAGAVSNLAVRLGGTGTVANAASVTLGTVFSGSGKLSFQWRTSSEQSHDYLILMIDSNEAARISGTKSGWLLFETNLLTVAEHAVQWIYSKDDAGVSGSDCSWIDSVTWTQFTYALTVEKGTGSGTHAVGSTVALTADAAPAGMEFNAWDGDTETLADPAAPATTLIMPARDITLRALYRTQTLSVTVINGSDGGAWPNAVHESTGDPEGTYPAGALVRIVASAPPLWQTFDRWVSTTGALFMDPYADITLFTMPSNHVTLTATYRPQTEAEKLSGALTIHGQPLVVTDFSPSGVVAEATGGIRYDDPVVKMGGPSVGPNQSVSLTTTNFTGNGYLFFWWRGDSEAEQDGVQLEVNGAIRTPVYSDKSTNTEGIVVWYLYGFWLDDTTNVTWRFVTDETYSIHQNMVLIDRVTWIPGALVDALGAGNCIPNINAEYDPLFEGRTHAGGDFDFEGEDGGVAWVNDAPGGGNAIRLGRFGYVTNNTCAQVAITNFGTGILTWEWTSKSEAVFDTLGFYIDGAKTNWISGKRDGLWYSSGFVVTPELLEQKDTTKNICTFRYQKDSDVSILDDCAWLRNVVWNPTFKLSVTQGSITTGAAAEEGYFPANSAVTILADTPESGSYFDRWTGDNVSALGSLVTDPHPTFPMPGYDLALTATYTTNAPAVPHVALTVTEGTGSGSYTNGTTVTIEATASSQWLVFNGWAGDTATVEDLNASPTTIVVGSNDLAVTATFTSMPLAPVLQYVLGVPAPVTFGNLTANSISLEPPSVTLGPIGNNQTAFFETVYTNAGTVIFPWSVNSEDGYDFLRFSIDGTNVLTVSGVLDGVATNFVAGEGPHVLRWSFEKDVSGSVSGEGATIRQVTWIPDALARELGTPGKTLYAPDGFSAVLLDTAPPAGAVSNLAVRLGGTGTVANAASVTLGTVFSGSGKLSFHWRTSSEQSRDYLILMIDGNKVARISGIKSGWLLFETNLLAVAEHAVQWVYAKDESDPATADPDCSDCGWVDSVTWTQFTHTLTVENGSGDGTYAVGSAAVITADPVPAGLEFNRWDGDTETVADLMSPVTTLVMPSCDITVRALYQPQTLTVTVVNGRDGGAWPNAIHESVGEPEGAYPAGAEVRIIADAAPLWQTFDTWVSTNGAVFTDAASDNTTFMMPSNSVTVTAVYRMQSAEEKLAGALTIAGQPLIISSFSSTGIVAESTGGVRYGDPVVKFGGPSVGANQYADLTITNFNGDGVLLFWWKGSAETAYDEVQVLVNGSVNGAVSGKGNAWKAMTNIVTGAASITLRFQRDGSYFVRDNTITVDRLIWIPQALINAMGCMPCVPDINGESVLGGFNGEDGGVSWVTDAPGGNSAVRFGRFGYVNNNQHAQLSVTNFGTGILMWQWASSSEAVADRLDVWLDYAGEEDDLPDGWVSGKEQSWSTASAVVRNGDVDRETAIKTRHTFLFDYSKDTDVSVFLDCAWLRAGTWTPTFQLKVEKGTNTSYSLPPAFIGNADVIDEAERRNIFPVGTQITLLADVPDEGYYFESWAGNLALPSVANPTFVMPRYDVSVWATYTTNAPPSSPAPLPLTHITSLAVLPAAPPQNSSSTVFALTPPTATVVLVFEGQPFTDYALEWTPSLMTAAGATWQPLKVLYREVLGDTAEGYRKVRLTAEIPSDAPQGFFRMCTP